MLARECIYAPAPCESLLRHQVCSRTKSIDAQMFSIPRQLQRTVANQTSAEQGSGTAVRVVIIDQEAIALIGHCQLRKSSVNLVTGKPGLIAQVFPAAQAESAFPACPTKPGNAYTV